MNIIDRGERDISSFSCGYLQLVAFSLAAEQHQFASKRSHINLTVYFTGDRFHLGFCAHAGPGPVGTAAVLLGDWFHQPQLLRFQLAYDAGDNCLLLNMVALKRRRIRVTQITWLVPEILAEILLVCCHHAPVEHKESVSVHILPAIPGLDGEAQARHFLQHLLLFRIQRGIGVSAAARFQCVNDIVHLVAQNAQRVHACGEYVGNGLRRSHHVGDRAIPHAFGRFHSTCGAISAAAAAVAVAIGTLAIV